MSLGSRMRFLPLLATMGLFLVFVSCDQGNRSTIPTPRGDAWWKNRHEAILEEIKIRQPEILFIGDSITRGWLREGKETWERCFIPRNAGNLGFGADKTQHLLWRLRNGEIDGIAPRVVVLLIGTNNQRVNSAAEIAAGVYANLQVILEKIPGAHVILMAIFPCRQKDHQFMKKINDANTLLARTRDIPRVTWVNIGHRFLGPDGEIDTALLPDRLHLSPLGYEIWARELEPFLAPYFPDRRCFE